MKPQSPDPTDGFAGRFPTTRWTQVRRAGESSHPLTAQGWDWLATNYWYPLYAFARRFGLGPDDAAEQTQDFFAWLLESDLPATATPERGRFRSLLLTAFKNHVGMAGRRQQRLKRGGGQAPLSLDLMSAEQRYRLEPATVTTPDLLFERRWALDLIQRALDRLEREVNARGQPALFTQLKTSLLGETADEGYRELAPRLGLSEGAVKAAAHRLRLRFRALVREEIAAALPPTVDLESELRNLQTVLGRG